MCQFNNDDDNDGDDKDDDNDDDNTDDDNDDDTDDDGEDDDKAGRAAPELLLQFVPTLYCPPTKPLRINKRNFLGN